MDMLAPGRSPQGRREAAGGGYQEGADLFAPEIPRTPDNPEERGRQTVQSIDDLMSRSWRDWVITDAEAKRAWGLLKVLPASQLASVVAALDEDKILNRLLSNLPAHVLESDPLTLLKLWPHRTRDDHQHLREEAITAVELSGQDPDGLLRAYTEPGLFPFFERMEQQQVTEQLENGTWRTQTYAGYKSYDIGITTSEVVVVVRLRLEAQEGVASLEEQKKRWLTGIKDRWNNQYSVSNGQKVYPLRFRPLFVGGKRGDRPFAMDVRVKPGAGRSNESTWYEEDSGTTTAAHEFGHVLGSNDEYSIPVYDEAGTAVDYRDIEDSIMSDFGRVHPRHLQAVLDDLNYLMRLPTLPAFDLQPAGYKLPGALDAPRRDRGSSSRQVSFSEDDEL
jgi:hypothetical protein